MNPLNIVIFISDAVTFITEVILVLIIIPLELIYRLYIIVNIEWWKLGGWPKLREIFIIPVAMLGA